PERTPPAEPVGVRESLRRLSSPAATVPLVVPTLRVAESPKPRLERAVLASVAPVPRLSTPSVFCVPSALCSTSKNSLRRRPHVPSSLPGIGNLAIVLYYSLLRARRGCVQYPWIC